MEQERWMKQGRGRKERDWHGLKDGQGRGGQPEAKGQAEPERSDGAEEKER